MSRPQIVVAGSGKMARDVGVYFLGRGHPVAWLSRADDRLEPLERWVRRRAKRLHREAAEADRPAPGKPSFFLVGDATVPKAELFVECINEAEEDKRALLEALEGIIPDDALRVSNSSSIAPDALHGECAGLHFFYPVELTGLVEAVFPDGFGPDRRRRLRALLESTELECIEEESEAAFAVNRLLLPLQAETLSWVLDGWDPAAVDESSTSGVLPVGQLALMDTIGLDVVHPAVCNFIERLDDDIAAQYVSLREGLAQLLTDGKRGRKNRDGLLVGRPLPWPRRAEGQPPPVLADRLRCLFANTCAHAIERGLLSEEQMSIALAALFDWSGTLEEMLAPLGRQEACELLTEAHRETGRLYFMPAHAFQSETPSIEVPSDRGSLI